MGKSFYFASNRTVTNYLGKLWVGLGTQSVGRRELRVLVAAARRRSLEGIV